ncbi:MAG: universal stress protein [Deltaproteobacteria bacterium]|nr:universal stress protein [Deltaproteobacteria bacterium]
MENQISENKQTDQEGPTILVAVDLSHYSSMVFRKIKSLLSVEPSHIVALHVIDHHFVVRCIKEHLGTKSEIKKQLFVAAKTKLNDLLRIEGVNRSIVEMVVCEGTPFIEINKKAIEMNADMIVMGNRGNSGDMESIFFKSTAEKVLRFIKRPVICIPLEGDYKLE